MIENLDKNVKTDAAIRIVSSATICLFFNLLPVYGLFRYAWIAYVFFVGSVYFGRFLVNIFFNKSFKFGFFVPFVLVVITVIYFDAGQRALIFGVGVGLTYVVAISVALFVPYLESQFASIYAAAKKLFE